MQCAKNYTILLTKEHFKISATESVQIQTILFETIKFLVISFIEKLPFDWLDYFFEIVWKNDFSKVEDSHTGINYVKLEYTVPA